jgi:hypothetical protein|tara:strand:- start:200 stop:532 length:333 start_codon:yes stop_codon:yes gene_type:complete
VTALLPNSEIDKGFKMSQNKTASKTDRVLAAFKNGSRLTAKQIEYRFGVASGRGVVRGLREKGYPIYSNSRTNSKGNTFNFYRLGTPTRKMMKVAFAMLGNDAFKRTVSA